MSTEIDSILDNMFLLVVTAAPDTMDKYTDTDFSVLQNKLRDLLPTFPDIQAPKFVMLKQATMILNLDEVNEVYYVLAKGIYEQKQQVETPEELCGYGMAYPVRIYSAFDIRGISLHDRKRLFEESLEDRYGQIATSKCTQIVGKELKSWEKLLKCKIADLNWFLEWRSPEI
jgi:hypothetical protein